MTSRSSCGTCPECGTSIPRSLVLIEYRREDGLARFAECPGCETVVHPDGTARKRRNRNR